MGLIFVAKRSLARVSDRIDEHHIKMLCDACYRALRSHTPPHLVGINKGWNTIDLRRPWTELNSITPDCCRVTAICVHFYTHGYAPVSDTTIITVAPEQNVLAAAGLPAIYAPTDFRISTRRVQRSFHVTMGFWAVAWAAQIANSKAPFFWRVAALKAVAEDPTRAALLETHSLIAPYPEHEMVIANLLNSLCQTGEWSKHSGHRAYRQGRDLLAEEMEATNDEDI